MEKIYSGKSKDVFSKTSSLHILKFKDEMRTADGRFSPMKNKAFILNNINRKIFEYLSSKNIKTHYRKVLDENSIEVLATKPIRLEFVVRRYAEGSFLKRNPKIKKHTKFEELVFEVFYKDDKLNDPYILFTREGTALIYKHYQITENSVIKKIPSEQILPNMPNKNVEQILSFIEKVSKDIFILLESKFAPAGGILCDFKIEFGILKDEILLIDSIEPDGWRLWFGNAEVNLDRNDAYEKEFTDSILQEVSHKYELANDFINTVFST